MTRLLNLPMLALVIATTGAACGGNKPPVAAAPPPSGPPPFPGAATSGTSPERPPDPPPIPDAPVTSTAIDPMAGRSVEEINGPNSPLKPVFFLYDSDTLDEEAKKVLAANAAVLKTYPTWVITVEGHCDERGSAEYNLALGDRRAEAARSYLVSLGIAAERLRKVSFGKEFPFDTGRTDDAYAQNRRAHFMLTSK